MAQPSDVRFEIGGVQVHQLRQRPVGKKGTWCFNVKVGADTWSLGPCRSDRHAAKLALLASLRRGAHAAVADKLVLAGFLGRVTPAPAPQVPEYMTKVATPGPFYTDAAQAPIGTHVLLGREVVATCIDAAWAARVADALNYRKAAK